MRDYTKAVFMCQWLMGLSLVLSAAVAVLRDQEGFSTEETAQILDISVANTKVRLHRARLFLREKLKGYFDHDPTPA